MADTTTVQSTQENRRSSDTIEDIILRHSGRGMTVLAEYMRHDFITHCASRILDLKRGVIFLTTGFYVAGVAETDGPPGTVSVAHALDGLGFTPVIITDRFCEGLFEAEGLRVIYVDESWTRQQYQALLDEYHPVAMISIERCGHNKDGRYTNMHGVSITQETAPIDYLFQLAPRSVLTVGIGDGGNEIGMGNLEDVLGSRVFKSPCVVTVDELIIATTSNWGAFALSAALSILSGKRLFRGYGKIHEYLEYIVRKGCVDGVTKEPVPSVDGFAADIEKEIDSALENLVRENTAAEGT